VASLHQELASLSPLYISRTCVLCINTSSFHLHSFPLSSLTALFASQSIPYFICASSSAADLQHAFSCVAAQFQPTIAPQQSPCSQVTALSNPAICLTLSPHCLLRSSAFLNMCYKSHLISHGPNLCPFISGTHLLPFSHPPAQDHHLLTFPSLLSPRHAHPAIACILQYLQRSLPFASGALAVLSPPRRSATLWRQLAPQIRRLFLRPPSPSAAVAHRVVNFKCGLCGGCSKRDAEQEPAR
jgi:hypothetical protein